MTFFSSSGQVVHWSAETQTKTDRSTKRVNSRSLTKLLFHILQNSRKNVHCCKHLHGFQTYFSLNNIEIRLMISYTQPNIRSFMYLVNRTILLILQQKPPTALKCSVPTATYSTKFTQQKFTTQGLTKRVNSRSLTKLLFRTLQNSGK